MSAPRTFDDLTRRGQLGRLRAVALDGLRHYDLDVERCSFAAQAFNTVFRVVAADGSTYALRVSPRLRIHADGCELAEATWLAALRDAGLSVPQLTRTRQGSVVASGATAGVPDPRSCVLFEWMTGRPLRERINADLVHKLGALTAVMHDHGGGGADRHSVVPPPGVLAGDRVLYFNVAMRLDELRPRYGSVLVEGVARAQSFLDDLWRHPPHRAHLLHGDVQPGNVLVTHNRVTLIDFQDLMWGFELQDTVIALHALVRFDDAPVFIDAFRRGYQAVRPWPDADPETVAALGAARHLNILNFGLSVRGPDLGGFIARHAGPVVQWMRG